MKMPWDQEEAPPQPLPEVNVSKYTLNDGREMPQYGLGTYMVPPGWQTYDAVESALRLGYRLIDTAQVYQNENDVGSAVLNSGLPREQVFVVTKLWGTAHGYAAALRAGQLSVRTLGLAYVDLFLMHDPGARMVETYDALLELRDMGLARSVGVANFGVRHLEALREAGRPAPAVNQVEMHPVISPERQELVEYCRRHGILVQAYGSMLSGRSVPLAHPALAQLAAQRKRTPTQVLLRWGLDRGFQVIPKSVSPGRMRENQDIFDFQLSNQEMELLETEMSASIGKLGVYWNPVDQAPVDLGDVTAHPHLDGAAWAPVAVTS